MDLRTRLESHTVKSLKAEIRKVKATFNYGKLKRAELIDLMVKNKDKFNHIQHADSKKPEPKKEEPKKVKKIIKKPEPKKAEPKKEDTEHLIEDLVKYGKETEKTTIFTCSSYYLDFVFLKVLENNKNDCALDFFFDPYEDNKKTPININFLGHNYYKLSFENLDKGSKLIAEKYLKCKKNKKLLVIPLRVKGGRHMNALIFNSFLNQLEWYEPHGSGFGGTSEEALSKEDMDKELQDFIKKMNSFMPKKDHLKYSTAENSCPRVSKKIQEKISGITRSDDGLQTYEEFFQKKDVKTTQGTQQRSGFCCMWSILQMDLRLRSPKLPEDELGTKLTKAFEEDPIKFFNKFIHGYTNSLLSELIKTVGLRNLNKFEKKYDSKTARLIENALGKVFDRLFKKI